MIQARVKTGVKILLLCMVALASASAARVTRIDQYRDDGLLDRRATLHCAYPDASAS